MRHTRLSIALLPLLVAACSTPPTQNEGTLFQGDTSHMHAGWVALGDEGSEDRMPADGATEPPPRDSQQPAPADRGANKVAADGYDDPAQARETAGPDYHQIAPGLRWGGSLRLRAEDKRNFKFGARSKGNDQDFVLTQVRLNLEWKPTDWLTLFVEGQDARVFGESSIDETAVPNIFEDRLDLHQAYFDLKLEASGTPVRVRVGRQKIVLGAQRLVSPLEWVNTARVSDAVRVTIGDPDVRTLDLFSSRLVAVDYNDFNDWQKTKSRYFNSDFHGVYYTDKDLITDTTLEAYYLLRHESDADDLTHTAGVRAVVKLGPWDANAELMGQLGEYGGLEHRAMAAHAEIGHTWASFYKSRLGAAYNYGSGDSDPKDDKHTTFDNLYPLNHAYYGFMDFFGLQNVHNAVVSYKLQPVERVWLRVAYHTFWLAKEDSDALYNAPVAKVRTAKRNVDPYVGSEIDVTIKVVAIKDRLTFVLGYSHFFSGAYLRQTGPSSDADFLYAQALLKF